MRQRQLCSLNKTAVSPIHRHVSLTPSPDSLPLACPIRAANPHDVTRALCNGTADLAQGIGKIALIIGGGEFDGDVEGALGNFDHQAFANNTNLSRPLDGMDKRTLSATEIQKNRLIWRTYFPPSHPGTTRILSLF